jgi:hypothetical protein
VEERYEEGSFLSVEDTKAKIKEAVYRLAENAADGIEIQNSDMKILQPGQRGATIPDFHALVNFLDCSVMRFHPGGWLYIYDRDDNGMYGKIGLNRNANAIFSSISFSMGLDYAIDLTVTMGDDSQIVLLLAVAALESSVYTIFKLCQLLASCPDVKKWNLEGSGAAEIREPLPLLPPMIKRIGELLTLCNGEPKWFTVHRFVLSEEKLRAFEGLPQDKIGILFSESFLEGEDGVRVAIPNNEAEAEAFDEMSNAGISGGGSPDSCKSNGSAVQTKRDGHGKIVANCKCCCT